MKTISKVLLGVMVVILSSCITRYIPVKETEYVTVRDSVYLRDTTIQYKVEKEYVKDYTGLLDTLNLETGMAQAKAWVDTTKSVLAGEIRNKEKTVDIPVQVKEKIVYRDSIVTKEVPVEVEKIVTVHPKYEKWLWVWLIASLLVIAGAIYLKVK